MGETRIDVTVGGISFSAEGEPKWLGEQLDKILEAASQQTPESERVADAPPPPPDPGDGGGSFDQTLAAHIRAKGGESNQTLRYLAAADWLRLRGETDLTTAKVVKALTDQQQKRLGNPADCLNKNVRKGLCEKNGKSFFITPDGLKALGHAS